MMTFTGSLGDPAADLAMDEALLEAAEAAAGNGRNGENGDAADAPPGAGEALRVWESATPFVVLGAGGRISDDVDTEACLMDGVPVLRRASGGGTVVQGPGCLSWAVVLDRRARPEADTIDGTTRLALARAMAALRAAGVAESEGHALRVAGISDLAQGPLKFGGNAQRRKRRHVLFHGTMLYGFDLALISRLLKEPPRRPEWRGGRAHGEFVGNLDHGSRDGLGFIARMTEALRPEWSADAPAPPRESLAEAARTLAAGRFSDAEWIAGF